uniref:Uncharacterized protein n=1 Tax=Anguilla anguilla TaxID=7936 RepID=A0A0E9TW22_ANGAN
MCQTSQNVKPQLCAYRRGAFSKLLFELD